MISFSSILYTECWSWWILHQNQNTLILLCPSLRKESQTKTKTYQLPLFDTILATEDNPPQISCQLKTPPSDIGNGGQSRMIITRWMNDNPIYTINLFGLISKTNFHQFRIISGTSILRRTVSIVSILWKFKIEWYVLKYTINLFELIPRQISTNFKLYWYKYFSTYSIFS